MSSEPIPEYPFAWDDEGRFAAVKAALEVLSRTSRPDLNTVDDALEAAVTAHNARLLTRVSEREEQHHGS